MRAYLIVLKSVVLVLDLVGIVHQVSSSPGQLFSAVIFKSARRSKCLWMFWFSTVGFQAHLGQEDSILYSILWFGKLGVFGTSPGKAFKGTHRIDFIVSRPHICHFFSTQIQLAMWGRDYKLIKLWTMWSTAHSKEKVNGPQKQAPQWPVKKSL